MGGDLVFPTVCCVTVDPDSPVPLYEQLAAILRERIASGDITSRVPSVRTLTQEYGVSHVTAEHALRILRDAGEITTTTGRGSFVRRVE